jgi:hypothetical protein
VQREAANAHPTRSTPRSKFSSIRAKPSNILIESTDLTIELKLVKLCTSGVDVFANFKTPKFAAAAIGFWLFERRGE